MLHRAQELQYSVEHSPAFIKSLSSGSGDAAFSKFDSCDR